MQIFQNILSMCDLIPLRIFDRKTATDLFKDFKESIENIESTVFTDDPIKALELMGISDEDLEIHVSMKESPWITTPSYNHPFWEEMQTSNRFTFWEQALIYKWIIDKQGKNPNEQIKSIISKKFLMGSSQLKEIDSDWFLISGPVFHFSGTNITGEEFNKNMILPLIDHLSEWLWPEIDGFLLSEQQQEMNLWGSLRPCWDRDGFKDHCLLISRILGNLLSAEWSPESPLRRCMCHDLVRKSWLLYRPTLTDVIYRLEKENELKNYTVSNLKFSFPLASHHSHIVDAYFENETWKFKIFPNEAKLEAPQITAIEEISPGLLKRLKYFFIDKHRKKEDSRFTLKDAQNKIQRICGEIDRRILSMEASYMQKRIIFLLRWFRRQFGLLTAPDSDINPLSKICAAISTEVNQLLTACQTNILQYDYEDEKLEVIGEHTVHKFDKVDIKKLMADIPVDQQKMMPSISYRTMRDGEPHFCRAVIKDGDTYRFDPEEEPIVMDEEFRVKSVITVPLKSMGRRFGVLEVVGYSPYQFRWENRQLLRRINEALSPLIFQTLIFQILAELTSNVIDIKRKESEKYNQICESMRTLFMAYAAVLWQPDRENPRLYRPCGWTRNRTDLVQLLKDKPRSAVFDIDNTYSLYHKTFAIANSQSFGTINIGKNIQDVLWVSSRPHRSWLRDKKINEVTIIPIKSPTSENLLILNLYYREKDQGLNETWEPVVRFMSYHTALLLEALLSQKKLERQVISIINHELKQKVDVILSRANHIYKYLYQHVPPDVLANLFIGERGSKSRLSLVFKDLKSYTASLHGLMNILQDEQIFERLRLRHTHPLHFLALEQLREWQDFGENREAVNLRSMFNEVFRYTVGKRQQKKLRDSYSDRGQSIHIHIIPEHLRTILNNLVDNAVKYAVPGSLILVESILKDFEIEFCISNEAQSLENPDEEQYQIFNESVQGSNSTIEKGQGQGLFIARLICELNEGELALEIKPHTESTSIFTFIVSFPRRRIQEIV